MGGGLVAAPVKRGVRH